MSEFKPGEATQSFEREKRMKEFREGIERAAIEEHAKLIYAHLYAQSFGPEQCSEDYYAAHAYDAAEAFHEYTQQRNNVKDS